MFCPALCFSYQCLELSLAYHRHLINIYLKEIGLSNVLHDSWYLSCLRFLLVVSSVVIGAFHLCFVLGNDLRESLCIVHIWIKTWKRIWHFLKSVWWWQQWWTRNHHITGEFKGKKLGPQGQPPLLLHGDHSLSVADYRLFLRKTKLAVDFITPKISNCNYNSFLFSLIISYNN